MSKKAYEETNINAIGQAIVGLTGATGYTVAQMADAISDNLTLKPTGSLSITANGTYNVADKEQAVVNVSGGGSTLGTKTITENGTYNASSDNFDGYSQVTVDVPNPSTGTINISQNGTYNVTDKASAIVSVSGGGSVPTGMYVGEFTLEADATTHDVSASFSATPKTVIVQYADGQTMPATYATLTNYLVYGVTNGSTRWTGSTQTASVNNTATISNVAATGFTCGTANATYPLKAGRYLWIAIV